MTGDGKIKCNRRKIVVNRLNIEMTGDGSIFGFHVKEKGKLNLIGNGSIHVTSDTDNSIKTNIVGSGKIVL